VISAGIVCRPARPAVLAEFIHERCGSVAREVVNAGRQKEYQDREETDAEFSSQSFDAHEGKLLLADAIVKF